MRIFLERIFSDDVGGPSIEMYNLFHILFLLIIIGANIGIYFTFRNKTKEEKYKVLDFYVIILAVLYFGDFFVHPFLEKGNTLIVDKLPFHICTISCPLLALIHIFPKKLEFLKTPITLLGMIGAVYYLFIPFGVTGPDVMAFRYRTIQTFTYHGVLFGYGLLSILFGEIIPDIKKIYRDAIVLASIILISIGANAAYSLPDHHYDWCFSTGSTFGMSPVIMPFIVFAVFLVSIVIICGICRLTRIKKKNS